MHGKVVLQVASLVVLLGVMLVVKLLQPCLKETVIFALGGMAVGLGLAYQFQVNRAAKMEAGHVVRNQNQWSDLCRYFGEWTIRGR